MGMSSHSMTTRSSRSLTEPTVLLEALFRRLLELNFLFSLYIVATVKFAALKVSLCESSKLLHLFSKTF